MRLFRVPLVLGLTALLTLPAGALRLEPLAEAAAYPASGPPLDRPGLVTLALVLSGLSPDRLEAEAAVLDRWQADFAATRPPQDPAKRGEALLTFLHTHLKSYNANQTRVDVLADLGTFNCVSSALAYMILGRGTGLDVQAVATKDHAFALVRTPAKDYDVETTSRFGFDPGTKTGFTDSFGRTGFVYVPPGNYGDRRTITDRELLGLLVQNRLADLQRSGADEEAIGPAIDRWTIEGTPEAFKTLVDGFVNYGARLNSRKEFSKGLDLVDQMTAWTGQVPEVSELVRAFLNNQVNTLMTRGDFAGAQALLGAWKNRGYLSPQEAAKTAGVIADQKLAASIRTQPWSQAAADIEAAFSGGLVTSARRQELLTFVYGQEVSRRGQTLGPRAAWEFLQGLPAEVRAFPALVQAQGVYVYNWSVEIHNQFVKLWNEGKHGEARKVLTDGLAVLKDNELLKKDLVLSQGG